ncbi:MAG: C40 family peptidase [Nocardiopsaceae bacterium]|nr:C40 family peptidase [Nocardiopsaceae bacterium]
MGELAPVSASASTTPSSSSGLLSNLLNPLTGSSPSTPKTTTPSSSDPLTGVLNQLPIKLPLLSGQSPDPSQSTNPLSGLLPGTSQTPAPSKKKPAKPAKEKPNSAYVPVNPTSAPGSLTSSATATAGTPVLAQTPIGYALPIPASVVSAHPSIIGEGAAPPSQEQAAQAVTLAVPRDTPVNAVTAGTLKIIPGANGLSTLVLSGTDGATYTYRNVAGATGKTVKAGQRIGRSGPGGLPFSIAVPDAKGPVDADEALQAWDSGLAVNVRSLPTTVAPSTAPAKQQVLVVTDSASKTIGSSLTKALSGPLVHVSNTTLSDSASFGRKSAIARQINGANGKQVVIVALAHGTPAQAAALAGLLHSGRQLLWVASPGTTAKQAAAYRSLTASHPGFRVESLPSALAAPSTIPGLNVISSAPTTGQANSAASTASRTVASQKAVGTLTATYATTAYRLYAISSQANTVLSWAELQLGKPYKWGANGPASFDCSGLTMDALQQAGVAVTHNAAQQLKLTSAHKVDKDQLQPGYLVFFTGSDGTPTSPGHVGLYVGDGEIIDAPYTGAPVRFDSLDSITGYQGATDPYAPAATPDGGTQALAQLAGLAVPSALSQYQTFAQQLANATWGSSQFTFLYELWQRESGWNPTALNPLSGAFGIPQSLPAGKMATAGMDWETDPYTQILWGIGYIKSAYGSPQAAWAHEESAGWY